jgi:hypothetical protein
VSTLVYHPETGRSTFSISSPGVRLTNYLAGFAQANGNAHREALTLSFARSFKVSPEIALAVLSGQAKHTVREDGSVTIEIGDNEEASS